MNNANSMNLETGIFSVTKDGIYHFSFSGNKILETDAMYISLRLNKETIASTYVSISEQIDQVYWWSTRGLTYILHSTLKLKKGDQIDLYLHEGTYYDDFLFRNHFSGIILTPIHNKMPTNSTSDDSWPPVHFYVQRNSFYSIQHSTIPFQLTKLNEGNAMNINSGIFTAPTDGIYRFALAGTKDDSNQSLWIQLRLNGEMIGSAYGTDIIPWATYSLQSILWLKTGDQVDLFLKNGTCSNYNNQIPSTHFTGSRLMYGKPLGNNSDKSLVYFYVQRNSSYSTELSTVPFDLVRLNVGGAINETTGSFTAPREGFYHFSLCGIKNESRSRALAVDFKLNGMTQRTAYGEVFCIYTTTYSIQATIKMHKGDILDVFLIAGTMLDNSNYHWTHYIGFLIE